MNEGMLGNIPFFLCKSLFVAFLLLFLRCETTYNNNSIFIKSFLYEQSLYNKLLIKV